MTKAKLPPGVRIRPDGLLEQRLTLDGARVSVYAKTLNVLKDKVEQRRNQHAQGIVRAAHLTVEDYLREWLAEVVAPPHSAPLTYTQRRGHAIHHLIPAIGDIPLDRLTTMDVRHLLNTLHRTPYAGRPGYAARTVNHVRSTLVAALSDAVREGILSRNVALLVRPLPVAADTRQPLAADDARRLLAAVAGDRLEALYLVGLICGLRLGEATGLTWDAVNLATGEVKIARALQWQTGGFVLKSPKNRMSARVVVLPAIAHAALVAHRARQEQERALAPAWGNDWNLVFTMRSGAPIHQVTVSTLLARHCVEANVPRQSYHMLRHAAASLLAQAGVPEIEVQALLGHASGQTTRRFYQHAYPSARQHVADTMDALLMPDSG